MATISSRQLGRRTARIMIAALPFVLAGCGDNVSETAFDASVVSDSGPDSAVFDAPVVSDSGSDSAAFDAPVVSDSGPDSAAYPNQPTGFVKITEHRGDPWPSDWWLHNPSNGISVIQDDTAPDPSMGTVRYFFPKGHKAGTGVGMMGHGSDIAGSAKNMKVDGQPVRELYLSFWIKHSAPWQQPDANVSKFFYTYQKTAEARNELHAHLTGPSFSNFGTKMEGSTFEDGVSKTNHLTANIQAASMPAGTWYRYEFYSKAASAAGVHDGIVKFWVDGALVGEYINIRRAHVEFTELHWSAVWGGTGGMVEAEDGQYILFNGIFASGR
jgi:hypothetical protein